MSAPTPGPHLDLDALADVEEELVPDEQAGQARAHLQHCADCRERLAQLRTTRALLTALPAETMPADVAVRLDSALLAAGASATVVPMNRRSRFWDTPAIAGAAAAVAILVLIGAVVVGNVSRHHRSSTTTAAGSSGAGAAPSSPVTVKEWSTGTNYSAQNIAAKVPLLVLGVPPSALSPQAGSVAPPATPSPVSTTSARSSATDLTQQDLRSSRAAILACGRILAGGVPTTPVAVDFAKFQGKPAVVVVLPAVGHPTTLLDVWVVRSTCSTSSVDLFFRRVARPTG